MRTTLLLIDIQNDYFAGGRMELEDSLGASEKARNVLTLFREKDLPLAHIQHTSARPGASFLIAGTEGVEIHGNVKPRPGELVIEKHLPNSFRDTSLLDHLRSWNTHHVVIAGMMTHMCVDATTRAAFDHGLQCTVLHDACATRTLSFNNEIVPAKYVQAAFLAALDKVYAKVMSTDEFIAGF